MQFKLKEDELIDYLELKYPELNFVKGRFLVGQHKQEDLHVYYLGEDTFACVTIAFKTFEIKDADILDYAPVIEIRLKDGMLFRKMRIVTEAGVLKYDTSKVLLSDFQKENYDKFIDGNKEKVIYKEGAFQ